MCLFQREIVNFYDGSFKIFLLATINDDSDNIKTVNFLAW